MYLDTLGLSVLLLVVRAEKVDIVVIFLFGGGGSRSAFRQRGELGLVRGDVVVPAEGVHEFGFKVKLLKKKFQKKTHHLVTI